MGSDPVDVESDRVHAAGLVIRDLPRRASNWRDTESLGDYLKRMTLQEASPEGLARIGPTAATLADFEGLEAHGMAVRARLRAIADRR